MRNRLFYLIPMLSLLAISIIGCNGDEGEDLDVITPNTPQENQIIVSDTIPKEVL